MGVAASRAPLLKISRNHYCPQVMQEVQVQEGDPLHEITDNDVGDASVDETLLDRDDYSDEELDHDNVNI